MGELFMVKKIIKRSENIWEIPKEGKMLVPGIVFASDKLMEKIKEGKTLDQIRNVACLPGIVKASFAMADAHQGYGFPIGGVAAFDLKTGIISPGGVGYDINCGVRLLASNLDKKDFLTKREKILKEIYKNVPSGVGKKSDFRLSDKEISRVLEEGVNWAVEKGYGGKDDIDRCEDHGKISGADPKKVSAKARGRGMNQLGSLGAGNHFLEIQEVEEIYDKKTAGIFGIKKKGQITVMIHSGSRGLGHQVAKDYIELMGKEYGTSKFPDSELTCAPINSDLGMDYVSAMNAAANFGFVNRHLIMHQVRESFKKYFQGIEINLVYDIAHNIAKFEEFMIDGKKKLLCVHRKGATRSFGKGRKEIPKAYRKTGQPIFIPGSMGTYSYVLSGTKKAEEISWASTSHGAGRDLSRSFAMKNLKKEEIEKELKDVDVVVKSGSLKGLVEEAPKAYKDVEEVVKVSDSLGLGKLVARLKPLGVVKG
jgi:tRNA-splicing ligase RtcB (3'-phosphate/5'-hydroxy nucleic acid ligase)